MRGSFFRFGANALVGSLILLTAVLPARLALSTPVLKENFNRNGELAGSSPVIGGVWTPAGSGTVSPIKSNRRLVVSEGTDQEEVSGFEPLSGTIVFAGVDLYVSGVPAADSWILPMGFHGPSVSGGDLVGRVFIEAGSSSETYKIGIDNDKDNPVWWPEELSRARWYRIMVGFIEFGAEDVTLLWTDPRVPPIEEEAEDVTEFVDGLVINAVSPEGGAGYQLDNLIVSEDFNEAAFPAPAPAPAPVATPKPPDPLLELRIYRLWDQMQIVREFVRNPKARAKVIRRLKLRLRKLMAEKNGTAAPVAP